MREVLEEITGNVKVSGRCITNLRYADDIVLIADTLEDLQDLVDRANRSSKRAGLSLNAKKTKVLKILSGWDNDDEKIFVNGEALENVKEFTYLGASINSSYDDSPEVKKRIAIAKSATTALTTIWKDRSISKKTKIRVLNALDFPIASYGCKTRVLTRDDSKPLRCGVIEEYWE